MSKCVSLFRISLIRLLTFCKAYANIKIYINKTNRKSKKWKHLYRLSKQLILILHRGIDRGQQWNSVVFLIAAKRAYPKILTKSLNLATKELLEVC